MKTTNTFSVVLFLRPNKRNHLEGLIYARITVNITATELSLKETVSIAQWNADRQEVDGRTPQVKALNAHLDNVVFKLKEKYRQIIDKDCRLMHKRSKTLFRVSRLKRKDIPFANW